MILQFEGRCGSGHSPGCTGGVEIHGINIIFSIDPPFVLSYRHGSLVGTQKRSIECVAPIDGKARARCLHENRDVRAKER